MGFYQAQKIEKLEARIKELEAQLFAGNDWLNARHAVLQDLAEANARIAVLEAALKPFAFIHGHHWEFTIGDVNAARAALEKNND
jgi:acetyl-CoA acetyltransferase